MILQASTLTGLFFSKSESVFTLWAHEYLCLCVNCTGYIYLDFPATFGAVYNTLNVLWLCDVSALIVFREYPSDILCEYIKYQHGSYKNKCQEYLSYKYQYFHHSSTTSVSSTTQSSHSSISPSSLLACVALKLLSSGSIVSLRAFRSFSRYSLSMAINSRGVL